MTAPLAYLDGRFLPFHEAALPLADAGFVFGATVVDNARTYRHKLFRWPEHLARFRRDCQSCFVPLGADDSQITAAAEELIAHNARLLAPGGELQLVTFATPGPLGLYLGADADGPPTLGMHTYSLPFARFRRFFTEGANLALVGHQPADPSAILPPGNKHRSRMAWWKADRLAKQHPPGAVALLADGPNGTITETAFASFLCVIDGCVVVPPEEQVLDGISLRATIELCLALGYEVANRSIPIAAIADMSEAMLAGTAFGIAGVKSIDECELTWPGPITAQLIAAWSDLVGLDVIRQFAEAQ
jgi:branched-chain amino acid aminotransferase